MAIKEFTPDNPHVVFVEASKLAETKSKIDNWLTARGGVAVWRAAALEMAGATCVTPAMSTTWKILATGEEVHISEDLLPKDGEGEYLGMVPTECPGWQWEREPAAIITDSACIVVKTLVTTDTVIRTYMDLELLTLAAEQAGITIGYEFQNVLDAWVWCDAPDYGGSFNDKVWANRLPKRLVIKHSRQAHNGSGYHVGTEEYRATLPIVQREDGDTFHGRYPANNLAGWLVRIDESCLGAELVNAPAEPVVKEGYLSDMAGSFVEGEPDEDHPGEKGYLIDGEFVTEEDYEGATEGFYNKPDDDFAGQEMVSVLATLLRQGMHRTFNRETKEWEIQDTTGKCIN